MKKLFLLFISVLSLNSCSSSDDENNDEVATTIIGKWNLISVNGETANNCRKQTTHTFENNFYKSVEYYLHDNDVNDCRDLNFSSEWKESGNNKYTLKGLEDDSIEASISGNKLTYKRHNGGVLETVIFEKIN